MSQTTYEKKRERDLLEEEWAEANTVQGPRPLPGTAAARLDDTCRRLANWSWGDGELPMSENRISIGGLR